MKKVKVGDFLHRIKNLISINDNDEYKLVTIKMYHKGIQLRRTVKGNEIQADKMSRVKAGQFILSGIDARHGAFGIVPEELNGAVVTNDFWHFEIDNTIISEEYFLWLTSTPYFDDICKKASDGTTNRVRLQADRFYSQELIIPDIADQHTVVEELKNKSNKIKCLQSELAHQLTLIENLNQAILQEAVQGKLVPQDPTDEPASQLLERIKAEKAKLIKEKKLKSGKSTEQPISLIDEYSIPENWIWCKTDDVFFITKLAGFEYTEHIKLKAVGEIPVVRAQNIRPLNIDKTNLLYIDKEVSLLLERCSLTKKCLLVTFIGAGIGDVATFDEKTRWHLAPNVAKMETFEGCEDLIDVKFINYFLMSNLGQNELFKHVKATAQPSLSMGTIRDIDIPLPPIGEQQRIVAEIEKQLGKTKELKAHIIANQQATEQLLKALLHGAFEVEEV